MIKRLAIYTAIFLFILLLIYFFLYFLILKPQYRRIDSLDTGIYRAYFHIYIYEEFAEPVMGMYYEVETPGVVESPKYFFYTYHSGEDYPKYDMIKAEGGELIGVVDKRHPSKVLIIYDFSSNNTWPRAGYTEHYLQTGKRGIDLLNRLRREHPDKNLELSK